MLVYPRKSVLLRTLSTRRALYGIVLTLTVVIASCNGRPLDPEEIPWMGVEETDQGMICLGSPDVDSSESIGTAPHRFEVGADLALQFHAARCFSSNCEPIEDISVTHTWNDVELQSSTSVRWNVIDYERIPPRRNSGFCFLDCIEAIEVVPIDSIKESGNYTLSWAGQSVDFEVPGESYACLATRVAGNDLPEATRRERGAR